MAHDYSTVLAEVKGELECCNLNWERALEELKLQDGELTRLRTVTDEMAIALRELMSAARPYLEPGGYPYGNPAIARARAALEAALEVHPAGEPDRREEN